MTPVSKWKMETEDEEKVRQLLVSELAKVNAQKEMEELIGILLSKTEKLMIGKRIFVFVLIEQGYNDMEIAKRLHFTRATVQRLRMNYEMQQQSNIPVKKTVKRFEESDLLKELLKKFLLAAMGRIPR